MSYNEAGSDNMIDKNSPIPVYYQLKNDFIKKISNEIWKVGECIWCERELCEIYGVSRMTIRQAIGELVQEGVLTRKRIVDNECIALETVYIPVDYCGHVNKKMLYGSLYKILEQFGYLIINSNSSIVAVNVNDEIRNLLECEKDEPILKIISKIFRSTDILLFLEESFYKSDKFTLQVNISRKEREILWD